MKLSPCSGDVLPYIGATAVQSSGYTARGIRVAILDTGIHYTQYNLGGFYRRGLSERAPDAGPNPLVLNGHGTRTSHIVGAHCLGGLHVGTTPTEIWPQREEDDGEAFTDIVNFGVMSVVSPGNSGDIPSVVGGPSSTPQVISVAATTTVNSSVTPPSGAIALVDRGTNLFREPDPPFPLSSAQEDVAYTICLTPSKIKPDRSKPATANSDRIET